MTKELELLKSYIQKIHPLSIADWELLKSIWQPFEAKRKVILTHEGEVEKYVYFVLSGIQRAYSVGNDGRDVSLVFTYPYSFSGVADSFLLQTPSRYFFETLSPSIFLRANFNDLDAVLLKSHNLERLFRIATSQTLSNVLVRQIELQSFTSEERFRMLLKRSGHVLNMIPHKYLASYLGMDATNFSKLLATVKVE